MQRLEIRETHKYVGSYKHMDDWTGIGKLSTVMSVDKADDSGEYGVVFKIVRVESDADADQIRKALKDTFTSEGCGCTHDCCGCRSDRAYGATELEGDENLWLVEIHWSINV